MHYTTCPVYKRDCKYLIRVASFILRPEVILYYISVCTIHKSTMEEAGRRCFGSTDEGRRNRLVLIRNIFISIAYIIYFLPQGCSSHPCLLDAQSQEPLVT